MKQANATGDASKLAAERTAIKDELRKMKNFPALEGAISFGANGDALKPVYVIQLQASRWTLIEQFAPECDVAQCCSSSEPKPSTLSSMPFCRSDHQ
jgi:branched-chain amino acid transport system substrate-binding protein